MISDFAWATARSPGSTQQGRHAVEAAAAESADLPGATRETAGAEPGQEPPFELLGDEGTGAARPGPVVRVSNAVVRVSHACGETS